MKIWRVLVSTALLVLTPVIAANAADLFTPVLQANTAQSVECNIVNIGSTTETVTLTLFNTNIGSSVLVTTRTTTLAPGQFDLIGFPFSGPPGANVAYNYCKFTVPDFLNFFFRASIWVTDNVSHSTVVALPAPEF